MELTQLVFKTETGELDEAYQKIDKLTTAWSEFSKVSSKGNGAASAAKEVEELAAAQKKAVASAEELNDALKKTPKGGTKSAEEGMSALDKLLEKLNNRYGDMVSGFTKGEAAILQQARALGASEDNLKPFISSLEKIKELTKDPFDASVGALRSVSAEFDKVTQRAELMAQGISMTTKQLGEYSRLSAEIKGQVLKLGLDPAQGKGLEEFNQRLSDARGTYLQVAAAVNQLTLAEENQNRALKENEKALEASIRANATMMNQAVDQFRRLEAEKTRAAEDSVNKIIDANERAEASANRLLRVSQLVAQGMSKSEATNRVDLQTQGVDPAKINSLIAAQKQLDDALKNTTNSLGRNSGAMSDSTKAAAFLERELARAENAVAGFGDKLKTSTSNRLFKFNEELTKAGFSPEEATIMMDRYRNAVVTGQKKMQADMSANLKNLSRDVSVQMGDVAVSLAGGMNPFTVMLQQGDQLRAAVQRVDVSSAEMQKAMTTAAGMIGTSFLQVGGMMASFAAGIVMASGKAAASVASFGASVTGLTRLTEKLTVSFMMLAPDSVVAKIAAFDNSIGPPTAAMARLQSVVSGAGTALTVLSGVSIVAAIAALGALAIAFIKVSNAQDELMQNNIKFGASMGLTQDRISDIGNSLAGVGASKASAVFNEVAKAGGFLRSEFQLLLPVAIGMNKYLGQSVEETVKQYSKFKKDPVDALFELALASGKVKTETINLVIEQQRLGDTVTATAIAVKEASRVHIEQIAEAKKSYSNLGTVVMGLKSVFTDTWDSMKNLFYSTTELTKLQKELKNATDYSENRFIPQGSRDEWKKRAEGIQKQIDDIMKLSVTEGEAAARQQEQLKVKRELNEEAAKGYTDLQKFQVKAMEMQTKLDKLGDSPENAKERAIAIGIYNKAWEDYVKTLNKKTPAEKESLSLQKQSDSALEASAALLTKLKGATEEITQAEKQRAALLRDPAFDGFKDKRKILANLNEAEILERKNQLQELNNSLIGKAEGLGSDYYSKLNLINIAYQEGAIGVVQYEMLNAALRETTNLHKKELAAIEATNAALARHAEFIFAMQGKTDKENSSLEFRLSLLGKTEEEQKRLTAIRERDIKLAELALSVEKELRAIKNDKNLSVMQKGTAELAVYEEEAKARKVINRSVAVAAAEDMQKEFDRIKSKIADALMTALFDGSKDGAKKLREVLLEELKRPLKVKIEAELQSMTGSLKDSAKDFLGKDGKGLENLFGTDAANSISSAMGSMKEFASAAKPYIAAYKIGSTVGKAIGDGYSTNGGSGNSIINAGAAIGTFWGPIGTAIGAAIGGVVNRAFGRKLTEVGIQGTFSGESFSGQSFKKEKGGWFRSDKNSTSALDQATSDQFTNLYQGIRAGTMEMAKSLGLGTDAIAKFSTSIKLNLKDMTDEEKIKAIEDEFGKISDSMAQLALGGTSFSRIGETATETLVRLSGSLGVVNAIFTQLGYTLFKSSLDGAAAADAFIVLLGGLEKAVPALSNFYDKFYTEEEKRKKLTESLSAQFRELGLAMPVSKLQYRVEVEKALAAGNQKLAAELIKLSETFDKLSPALEGLAAKFGELFGKIANETLSALDKQISASQAAANQAADSAKSYFDLAKSLKEASTKLGISAASPVASVEMLRNQMQSTYGSAVSGNVDSLGKLSGQTDDFLQAYKQVAVTKADYDKQTLLAKQQLDQAAAVATTLGLGADYQAKLYDVNTAMLQTLKADLENTNLTVDRLNAQLVALKEIGVMLEAGNRLTVSTAVNSDGVLTGALKDGNGKIVAGLDNNVVLQLQSMRDNALEQVNATTGQTIKLGSLSQEQLIQLEASRNAQLANITLTDLVAQATKGSADLLSAVLAQLKSPDAGAIYLSGSIHLGHQAIVGKLQELIDATKVVSNPDIPPVTPPIRPPSLDPSSPDFVGPPKPPGYPTYPNYPYTGPGQGSAYAGGYGRALPEQTMEPMSVSNYQPSLNTALPNTSYQSATSTDTELVGELQMLRNEVVMLRAETRATVSNTAKTAKLLDRASESDVLKVQIV